MDAVDKSEESDNQEQEGEKCKQREKEFLDLVHDGEIYPLGRQEKDSENELLTRTLRRLGLGKN